MIPDQRLLAPEPVPDAVIYAAFAPLVSERPKRLG
jgi:hypothetical protein